MTKPYLLRCPSCRARNRIPPDKAGATARCGKCGTNFATDILNVGTPVKVTDANFHEEVLKSPLPILLYCWAAWCGPCQMMGPFMTELASEAKGRVRIGKMNVDENPRTASQYFIRGIPTLFVFENGELRNTLNGAHPKHSVKQAIAHYL